MKRWFLSTYITKIKLVEQGNRPDYSPFGSFFDTFEDARQRLVEREMAKIAAANKEIDKALKNIEKAKKMSKPEDAA